MKRVIVTILLTLSLFACQDNKQSTINTSNIEVSSISVQEINDGNFIKEITFEPNEKAIKAFGIINKNFKTLPLFDRCNNFNSIKTKSYIIENMKTSIENQDYYSYNIYKKTSNGSCEKVITKKDAKVYKAVEIKDKLYLEVDNFVLSGKRDLMRLSNNKIKKVKADIETINQMYNIKDELIIAQAYKMYYLSEDKLQKIEYGNNKKILTYFMKDNIINIMVQDQENNIYFEKYILGSGKLTSFKKIEKKEVVMIDENEQKIFRKTLPIITKQSSELVVINDTMICETNLKSCRYVQIEGEKVLDISDFYVLYESDRIYLSNFKSDEKEVLFKSYSGGMLVSGDRVYFRVENKEKRVNLEYTLNVEEEN